MIMGYDSMNIKKNRETAKEMAVGGKKKVVTLHK